MEIQTKICLACGDDLPLDDFWNHPTGKFGKRPRCKKCVSLENKGFLQKRLEVEPEYNRGRVKAWASTGDNVRAKNLRARYRLAHTKYDAMYASQDGKCAICGLEMDEGRRLAVDHDHETGEIRGIIHLRCNLALGLFKDSPDICRKAAEYLEKYPRTLALGDSKTVNV